MYFPVKGVPGCRNRCQKGFCIVTGLNIITVCEDVVETPVKKHLPAEFPFTA